MFCPFLPPSSFPELPILWISPKSGDLALSPVLAFPLWPCSGCSLLQAPVSSSVTRLVDYWWFHTQVVPSPAQEHVEMAWAILFSCHNARGLPFTFSGQEPGMLNLQYSERSHPNAKELSCKNTSRWSLGVSAINSVILWFLYPSLCFLPPKGVKAVSL